MAMIYVYEIEIKVKQAHGAESNVVFEFSFLSFMLNIF